jgi:hypothetical protein
MRYELADDEWAAIKPMLPNKPRGASGRSRHGAPERKIQKIPFRTRRSLTGSTFGPYTTCYNRFVRWRRAGVWSRRSEMTGVEDLIERLEGSLDPDVRQPFCEVAKAALASLGEGLGEGSDHRTLPPLWRQYFHPPVEYTPQRMGPRRRERWPLRNSGALPPFR